MLNSLLTDIGWQSLPEGGLLWLVRTGCQDSFQENQLTSVLLLSRREPGCRLLDFGACWHPGGLFSWEGWVQREGPGRGRGGQEVAYRATTAVYGKTSGNRAALNSRRNCGTHKWNNSKWKKPTPKPALKIIRVPRLIPCTIAHALVWWSDAPLSLLA